MNTRLLFFDARESNKAMKQNRARTLLSLLTVLTVADILTGCGRGTAGTVLGKAPADGQTVSVKALAAAPAKSPVLLQGEMVEKCPVAGCWFVLRDKTGTVRVDTKAANFVVTNVPLHAQVTVAGTVLPGDTPGVAATGVRY